MTNVEQIKRQIKAAIKDEESGQHFYDKLTEALIDLNGDYNNAELIAEIAGDEMNHEKILRKMLKDYRG